MSSLEVQGNVIKDAANGAEIMCKDEKAANSVACRLAVGAALLLKVREEYLDDDTVLLRGAGEFAGTSAGTDLHDAVLGFVRMLAFCTGAISEFSRTEHKVLSQGEIADGMEEGDPGYCPLKDAYSNGKPPKVVRVVDGYQKAAGLGTADGLTGEAMWVATTLTGASKFERDAVRARLIWEIGSDVLRLVETGIAGGAWQANLVDDKTFGVRVAGTEGEAIGSFLRFMAGCGSGVSMLSVLLDYMTDGPFDMGPGLHDQNRGGG